MKALQLALAEVRTARGHLADGRTTRAINAYLSAMQWFFRSPVHTLHPSRRRVLRVLDALKEAIKADLKRTRAPLSHAAP